MTTRTPAEVAELIAAIELALPYVERVAATTPFEPSRKLRQLQASRDAVALRECLERFRATVAA